MSTFDKSDQPSADGYYGGSALTPATRWTNRNYVEDLAAERDDLLAVCWELRAELRRYYTGPGDADERIAELIGEHNVAHLFDKEKGR